MNAVAIDIYDNEVQQQFEITMDGELATLQYRFYKNDVALMHTHVHEKLKGEGLATILAIMASNGQRGTIKR